MPTPLRNSILIIIVCAILVTLCYFGIDKPVAFFVYNKKIDYFIMLRWFTYIAVVAAILVILIYLVYVIKFCYRKVNYFDNAMLAMANSMIIASFLKIGLKGLFGRYWPKTWLGHNPSLISNNAYGFHFLHYGNAYGSFPSGHSTVITAAMTTLWFTYPRWRWLYVLAVALVALGLIGMDYHFVSDVIAGGVLGALVGYFVVAISFQNRTIHKRK